MKSKIMIKNLKVALLTLFLMMISVTGYSQACPGNQVTVSLQNFVENDTHTQLEFDVFVSNTGTTTLQLNAIAGAVIHNVGALPAGATGSFAVVPGQGPGILPNGGNVNFPTLNNVGPAYTPASRQMRWSNSPSANGTGTILAPGSPALKFARFRFTSTLPFTQNFAATLTPQFNAQAGFTNVVATVYCNGNPNSTPLSVQTAGTMVINPASYPIILNPINDFCFTSGTASNLGSVSCFGGSNGSATITMNPIPSSLNATYSVDGGASTPVTLTAGGSFDVSGLSAGPHSISVVNNTTGSCPTTPVLVSLTISQPTELVASSTAGTIACFGGTTTVTVTAEGGTAPYSGEGTFTVSAGPYSYTVTDANGCTSTTSGSVSEPTQLVASSTAGTIACFGGTTTVTVTAEGGTAPYSGAGTFTVSAGAYSYTVTDANGCTSTTSGSVSEPTELVASSTAGTIACFGGTTTVTVTAEGGTAPYSGTGTFTVSAGAYSYTVTDANGCTSTTSGSVNQPAELVASATAGTIACFGGSTTIDVSATGGTAPYTGTGSFASTGGNYSYTVTDANGCSSTVSGSVSVPTELVASSTAGTIACFGGTTTVTVTAEGGTAPYSGAGTFTVSAGAYSYTVTDANGCTSTTSGSVSEPTELVASSTAGTIACFGGTTTVTVTAEGGTAPYSGTGTFTVSAGAYSYTVTDANGCTSTTSGSVNQPAELVASATAGTIACFGGSTTIDVSATGGTAPYTGTGSFASTGGNYSYTVTDANGCSSTVSGSVSVPTELVASSTAGTIACFGGTTTVTVTAEGGTAPYSGAGTFTVSAGAYSYTVTDANGCTSTTSGSVSEPTQLVASSTAGTIACFGGTTTVTVTAEGGTAPYSGAGTFTVSAGAYSYTVTDANGCTSTTSGSVNQPAALVASSTVGTIVCFGGTTTVTVAATGGTAPYSGTGTFTVSAGAYSYTVTDANGCSSITSGTVTQPAQLTTTTNITQATPYTWSVSGLTYSTTGSYTFNTVNGNGCTVINTLNLTIATGPTTVISPTQCGSTLTAINQQIYANLVPGAQGYRFRVTDLTTSQVQSIDKALRVFSLNQLASFNFARTYSIEVAVLIGGVWQSFGAPCNVTTPSASTQVQASQCDSTLTAMGDVIYANNVLFALGYQFRITNLLTSASIEVPRGTRDVRLNNIAGFTPEFNTTYSVEVAVQNRDGNYLPYGPVCNITTPSFPTTQLQLSQCDVTISNMNTVMYADAYIGATTYRFRFISGSFSYTFDQATRSFVLSSVPGLVAGTSYSVQVSIEINGVFGPYGKICTLTLPGVGKADANAIAFQATAYPNPFAENFMLDVKTSSEEYIQVRVYDMLGKLIEDKKVDVSSITNLEIGTRYPSGVYNVIVSQGDVVKTLRVIKR